MAVARPIYWAVLMCHFAQKACPVSFAKAIRGAKIKAKLYRKIFNICISDVSEKKKDFVKSGL